MTSITTTADSETHCNKSTPDPASDEHVAVYPFKLDLKTRCLIDSQLQEEISHLDRRLRRVLEHPDRSAIILDARAIGSEAMKRAVFQFIESQDVLQSHNLVIVLFEYLVPVPDWCDFRQWFRTQIDSTPDADHLACMVFQAEGIEIDSLTYWAASTHSEIVTSNSGIGDFAKPLVRIRKNLDGAVRKWLDQAQAASGGLVERTPPSG